MKNFVLFISALIISNVVSAQFFYFNGTSYTQTFDNISTGTPSNPNMPVEWTIYTDATSTTLGTPRTLLSSSKGTEYHWRNTTGGFKNVASADGFTSTTDSATQMGSTDRALAVRQVSSSNANFGGSDPGAAFVFRVSNTKNLTDFTFSFKFQSLDDTSHRETEWAFEYALGDNPTAFTPIATSPASLKSGGDVFSNTTVTGSIPSAIDKSNVPVYLRIRSLSAAQPVPPNMGGNRATTAIDDFKLMWKGEAVNVNNIQSNDLLFNVLGTPTSNKIVLGLTLKQRSTCTISIFDLAGKMVHATNTIYPAGKHVVNIDGMSLASGMYIVKMNDGTNTGVRKFTVQ